MNLFQRAIDKFNKEVNPAITQQGAIPEFPVSDNQAASTASTVATLKDDLNALLTKLKAAGLMKADQEPPEEGDGDSGDQEPPEEGDGDSGDQEPEAT